MTWHGHTSQSWPMESWLSCPEGHEGQQRPEETRGAWGGDMGCAEGRTGGRGCSAHPVSPLFPWKLLCGLDSATGWASGMRKAWKWGLEWRKSGTERWGKGASPRSQGGGRVRSQGRYARRKKISPNQSSWKEQNHTQVKGSKQAWGLVPEYLIPWILFFNCFWLTSHLPSFYFSITNAVRNTILSDLAFEAHFSSFTHTHTNPTLLLCWCTFTIYTT